MSMLNKIKGFHIEPTNICTLKCPRCSRTSFIEKFPSKWKNQQLDLEHFKNFIDIEITGLSFSFRGDVGDPIYYDDLIPAIRWIKKQGGFVKIHTNGSYKKQAWWQELCTVLDRKDTVTFGIDGTPENFTQYRINADWESIKVGIEETTKVTNTIWQYIPFSYNIDYIETARQLSQDMGFTEFKVRPTSRWLSEADPLRPAKEYIKTTDYEVKWHKNIIADEITPRCKNTNYDHYITSTGHYTPCCHSATYNFYYKTEFYKNQDSYDISKTTISQVLTRTQDFYDTLENKKHLFCTYNCPKI